MISKKFSAGFGTILIDSENLFSDVDNELSSGL